MKLRETWRVRSTIKSSSKRLSLFDSGSIFASAALVWSSSKSDWLDGSQTEHFLRELLLGRSMNSISRVKSLRLDELDLIARFRLSIQLQSIDRSTGEAPRIYGQRGRRPDGHEVELYRSYSRHRIRRNDLLSFDMIENIYVAALDDRMRIESRNKTFRLLFTHSDSCVWVERFDCRERRTTSFTVLRWTEVYIGRRCGAGRDDADRLMRTLRREKAVPQSPEDSYPRIEIVSLQAEIIL